VIHEGAEPSGLGNTMLSYLMILAISVAGAMHASWWLALVGAMLLALTITIESRRAAADRNTGTIALDEPVFALSAFINGTAAAAVAFLLGRSSFWFWFY
jgi:hypothetical protein